MSRRATVAALLAFMGVAGLTPATASAEHARVYKMVRKDMRISLNVKDGEILRGQVRALETCGQGEDAQSGFLDFKLVPSEPIPLRRDGTFHFGESFDDARGSAEVLLNGRIHRRAITGIFAFKNRSDRSCGTGTPGHRKVGFRATLRG